jgi:hypothetical protein
MPNQESKFMGISIKWENGARADISPLNTTYFSHSFPINKLDKVGQVQSVAVLDKSNQ